ncbi:MAG: GldG family protein [Oscillospiraceae bacterium]|nr:GldG family protein [Oscillospiraceae bacterium]
MKKPNMDSVLESFKTRSFRVGGYSIVAIAIVLAIVIAINLFAAALPVSLTQYDITANNMFSISEQTETLIKNLNKDITIYWIVSAGQEDPRVENMLTRVDDLSDRITVVRKDTTVNPTFASKYTQETVYDNSLVVECGERARYLDVSTDIFTYDYADYYSTGKETTYFNGEGALVSALDYVTSEKLSKLYLLTGHGEQELSTIFATALKNQNLETAELSLLSVTAVPDDADGILINTPASDISEPELNLLRAYMEQGGSLFFLTDVYSGESVLKNFEALMADYGMTSVPGIVVEADRNYYFAMQMQEYQQEIRHALLPTLAEHPINTPLINAKYRVLLNGAHGILVNEELPEDVEATALLTTSYSSYSKLVGGQLETYDKELGDIDGPFAVAALATKNAGQDNESNVVWVSSPTMVDEMMDNYTSGGNQDMFLNILTYLCEPETKEFTIHAKTVTQMSFLTMESKTAALLAILVVAVIPVTFLGCGVVVWFRRKQR